MIPKRSAVVAIAAAALVLAAGAGPARAGDLLQKKDGSFSTPVKNSPPAAADFTASNITVISATTATVTYSIPLKDKQITQTVGAAEVMEILIEPSRFPREWKDASEFMEAGDAKGAALFRAIGNAKNVNEVVRQKALLNAARAEAAAGSKGTENAYREVLAVFPQSFYTKTVWRELANVYMDRGDEEKALAAITSLLALPGISDSDKIEARFLKNTVTFRKAVAAKDPAAIQKCFDEYKVIAQETGGKPDLASVNSLARLGMGNCLLELGNFKDAKGIFEDLSERSRENSLTAAAFNGLGECWFRLGTPEGFAEARLCFLRTVTMYTDGAPPDQIARALYGAGECFFKLQDADDWKTSAARELNECHKRFPTSPWAEKAKRLLLNLK